MERTLERVYVQVERSRFHACPDLFATYAPHAIVLFPSARILAVYTHAETQSHTYESVHSYIRSRSHTACTISISCHTARYDSSVNEYKSVYIVYRAKENANNASFQKHPYAYTRTHIFLFPSSTSRLCLYACVPLSLSSILDDSSVKRQETHDFPKTLFTIPASRRVVHTHQQHAYYIRVQTSRVHFAFACLPNMWIFLSYLADSANE